MLKYFLLFFAFSIVFSSEKGNFEKKLNITRQYNTRILALLELLERSPLIFSISLKGGNFTLERKPFKYNPGEYLGSIVNALNERLPDKNNKYFDLNETMTKYKNVDDRNLRHHCIKSYEKALKKLEIFLKKTWKTEKDLRSHLNISSRKFENATFVEGKAIGNPENNLFLDMKINFTVTQNKHARDFIIRIIDYIAARVEFIPQIEEKEKKGKKEKKKKNK